MQNHLEQSQHIHFIGIGGIGMSALAQILFNKGKKISGSDKQPSSITESLSKMGLQIFTKQSPENIDSTINLVIYSNAISELNAELKKAKEIGIRCINLSKALGEFSEQMKTIAICGTHGKSTTTALAAIVLVANQQDPTVSIGTKLKEFEYNNFRTGHSDIFLVEACEYKRAFLHLSPEIIIITNIEADHLDYFKDEADYKNAYRELIQKLPENGIVITNADDKFATEITQSIPQKVIKYSLQDKESQNLNLKIPGRHNIQNALAVAKLAEVLSLDKETTYEALNSFTGSWRRFETKGKIGNTTIIDDYAHHPTEIKATLQAARERFSQSAKFCVVFQPHQHSRTHKLLEEFKTAFDQADIVVIPNIYEVRDSNEDISKISAQTFVEELQKVHHNVHYTENFQNTAQYIKENIQTWDAVLIMGAGDITNLCDLILPSSS